MWLEDPIIAVPLKDADGNDVSDHEYNFMVEVAYVERLSTVPSVVARCLSALDLFRDTEGLLGFVPRHWADGMHLNPHLFRRIMGLVRDYARSREDVVRIVDEEIDQWRRARPQECGYFVVNEEAKGLLAKRELSPDEYWLVTKKWHSRRYEPEDNLGREG
jgi:hypothetical protein